MSLKKNMNDKSLIKNNNGLALIGASWSFETKGLRNIESNRNSNWGVVIMLKDHNECIPKIKVYNINRWLVIINIKTDKGRKALGPSYGAYRN